MARAGLKHWMLHDDQLAAEFDEALNLSPGFDPVREVDPALTFHASLLTGPDSIPGAIRATVKRNSEGTYQAPRGAFLLSALDDESRHEYTAGDEPLGVLMEPASTNSSGVDNLERVDPSDWLLSGGPATIERIVDHDLIASAGLTKLCPNGELLRITAQSDCRFWLSPSSPGSTEDLGLSVYARGRFYLHSGYASSPQFTHEALERAEYIDSAANALRVFSISVDAGDVCEFIGWGIEIQDVVTSLIHTPFGPASRAVDQLSWPLAGGPIRDYLISDPFFGNEALWALGQGWSFANNRAHIDGSQPGASDLNFLGATIEANAPYEITLDIVNTTGGVRALIDGQFSEYYSAGVHKFIIWTVNDDPTLAIRVTASIVSEFREFSCRKLTPILNQAEGMLSLIWRPQFSDDQILGSGFRPLRLIRYGTEAALPLYFQKQDTDENRFYCYDGTSFTHVTIPGGLQADTDYAIAIRWQNAEKQVGFKVNGSWSWSDVGAYDGEFTEEGVLELISFSGATPTDLPNHARHLKLWNEDRGIAWLEEELTLAAN